MSPQFSAGQSVATARILLAVIRHILESVMRESEDAVVKITDSLNNLSDLSSSQRELVSQALEAFYHSGQSENFKQEINDSASAILDAAVQGDFAKVNEIGSQPSYTAQASRTKSLHDSLQDVIAKSETLNDTIMPLLISLQFQDKLKQQLVGVLRALELFIERDTVAVDAEINFDEFWEQVQKGFNVVETRNAVLRIVKAHLVGKAA
jgi:hypothetical protein